jgi:sugar phosphate isomerase/epimerase
VKIFYLNKNGTVPILNGNKNFYDKTEPVPLQKIEVLMKTVVVTMNSFQTDKVQQSGQGEYVNLIAQAGAQGAEIRRELFTDQPLPLKKLQEQLEAAKLFSVYSAPVDLYNEAGELDVESITTIVLEAVTLGSEIVKFSLGQYKADSSKIQDLKKLLHSLEIENHNLQVTIENDQTMHGGNLERIYQFLKEAAKHDVPVKMTFDIGNWLFTGEEVWAAAKRLSPYVVYVHFKHVERNEKELVTLPLPEAESADWRKLLTLFSDQLPCAIEFPLRGEDLQQTTKHYTLLLANA